MKKELYEKPDLRVITLNEEIVLTSGGSGGTNPCPDCKEDTSMPQPEPCYD